MKTWIISDTHFYHDKLVEKGGRDAAFEARIVHNWQRKVAEEDLVIHLGDVSWANDLVVNRLRGRKILVRGNHDKKSDAYYMQHGFDFSCHSFTMNYGGWRILFSHKPIENHGYDLNIHGHLHNVRERVEGKYYLVCLEENGYDVESLSGLIPKLRKERGEE